MGKLFEELKRRKVFRVAAVYAVVAWLLIQVADVVLPTFGAPAWVSQTLIFLFILGFPIAVILSWAYEVSPEGITSDPGVQAQPQVVAPQNQQLIYAIFVLVLLVAGFNFSDRFFSDEANSTIRSAGSGSVLANPTVARSSIILNQALTRIPGFGARTGLSLAPDGSTLAYAADTGNGVGSLLLRDLATQETQEFEVGFATFFYSPDGQNLLVWQAGNSLSIMPAQGGGLRPLPIELNGRWAWFSDEEFVYRHTDAALAVDDVSFEIAPGKTLALVGESGCGKSMTALSILGLVPDPPGKIVGGSVLFEDSELVSMSESDLRTIRGNDISMIFQEPMTSLNPVFRVGGQIGSILRMHQGLSKSDARAAAIDLLNQVGIPAPELRVDDYPHQLSGGMRQRVMIAMALACNPKVLIADEPTTALDVTIQAQILDLLRKLQQERGMAILLITHDLGVVAEMADEVAIMYAGKIVERAPAAMLFEKKAHPYTQGLFNSLPTMNQASERLETIDGQVPAATDFPTGCRFHPRCPKAMAVCATTEPECSSTEPDHEIHCWLFDADAVSDLKRSVPLNSVTAS